MRADNPSLDLSQFFEEILHRVTNIVQGFSLVARTNADETENFELRLDQKCTSISKQRSICAVAQNIDNEDGRALEVFKMLDSSIVEHVSPDSIPNPIETDITRQNQLALLKTLRYKLSAPMGRACFTFQSVFPNATSMLSIPELCLKARIKSQNIEIELDVEQAAESFIDLPRFQNALASAVELNRTTGCEVSRSWIMNQVLRLESCPFSTGGFLLGMGINGFLRSLTKTDLYNLLTRRDTPISFGVLLGMSISKYGSMDDVMKLSPSI